MNNTFVSVACSKCFKAITGSWTLEPKADCKTGRSTGMDGYILSDSSTWVSCYCESCWKSVLSERLDQQEPDLRVKVKNFEENWEVFMRESQMTNDTLRNLRRKYEEVVQDRDNLKQNEARLNSLVRDLEKRNVSLIDNSNRIQLQCTEFQGKLRILEGEKKKFELEIKSQKKNFDESLKRFDNEKLSLNLEIGKLLEERQVRDDKLENFKKQIEDLIQERDNLRQNEARFSLMVKDLEKRNISLVDNVNRIQLECTELQNEKELFKNEKKKLEQTIKSQKKSLGENLKNFGNEKDKLSIEAQRLLKEKQVKEEELRNFERHIEDLTRQRDIFKENELKLNSLVKDLGKEDKSLKDKNTELQDQISVLKNENEKRNLEIQRMLNNKQTIQKQLESLEKQNEDLVREKNSLLEDKQKDESQAEDLRIQLQSLTEKSKQIESQYDELRTKLDVLENEKKRLSIDESKQILQYKEKRILEEDFNKYYDCRIMADSFYTLLQNKSWDIQYKDFHEYLQFKAQNTTKVAVLGYENTGKSFILSKLTGFELPQGTLMKTTGICLKYPTEKYLPWTALDTPGTNISIKTQQMKEKLANYFEEKGLSDDERMRMLLGDNILMENLLQEFVVKHAQVLLVVIGKLHRDDQKLVNRIKMLSGKRIIVVHNLLDARQKEDVEKIIKEDILDTFSVTEKPIYLERIEAGKGEGISRKVYLENDEKNDRAIEHVVMAHEGSPAGDYYNESAITYIKTLITSMPFVRPFDLVEAFRTHFNANLKYYLYSKVTENGDDQFIFEKDENEVLKGYKLNDHLQYDLKLSSADEFGQIRTFAREGLDNIPLTVKIVDEKTDAGVQKVLRVELEIVGQYEQSDIMYKVRPISTDSVRIEIKGKSKDNTVRSADCDILENTRKFGDFNIITEPINLNGYTINRAEDCRRITAEVPGLMILAWNLYESAEDTF